MAPTLHTNIQTMATPDQYAGILEVMALRDRLDATLTSLENCPDDMVGDAIDHVMRGRTLLADIAIMFATLNAQNDVLAAHNRLTARAARIAAENAAPQKEG